jgi:hypothetical protein
VIRARCGRLTNSVNAAFWTTAQLNTEIDALGREFRDLIVEHFGVDREINDYDITTAASASSYSAATITAGSDTIYYIRGVGIQNTQSDWIELEEFIFPGDYWRLINGDTARLDGDTRWAWANQTLYLVPVPVDGRTVKVWVEEIGADFAAAGSIETYNGWGDWIVHGLCALYRESERKDPTFFLNMQARQVERIRKMASRMTAGGGTTIRRNRHSRNRGRAVRL